MKLLKNKKSIIGLIAALTIFISSFGNTVFAATTSKKISDRQAAEVSDKAFQAFRKLFSLGVYGKEIKVGNMGYSKISSKLKNEGDFHSYVEKKTGVNKYFSKKYERRILQFVTVEYKGDYYMEVGDPEICINDLANAKVKNKKYDGKSVTLTLCGQGETGETTTTLSFTYERGRWVLNTWPEINEKLGMN